MSNSEFWNNLIDKIDNMTQEEFDKLSEECDKEIWAWDLPAEESGKFQASLSASYKLSDKRSYGSFELNKTKFFTKSVSDDKPYKNYKTECFNQEFSINNDIEAA